MKAATRVKDGGWDLQGGADPLSIIPKNAVKEKWTPIPGGAQKGAKWKWTDPETGKTVRLRVYDADPSAPAGSNAAKGDIVRIQIGNQFQDVTGRLYHKNVHKPASPNYNSAAANATHIPWPSQHKLPY